MNQIINTHNFLVAINPSVNNDLVSLGGEVFAASAPVMLNEQYCMFHGILFNADSLAAKYHIKYSSIEEFILKFYALLKDDFAAELSGNYSLLIGNRERLLLLRDGNGNENLYYYLSPETRTFYCTNSIWELKKFIHLEVNIEVLPEYFIKTDIHQGSTFFKNICTLGFFQSGVFFLQSFELSCSCFDNFFLDPTIIGKINQEETIRSFDRLFAVIMKNILENPGKDLEVINALSGGTDSSFVQYFLSKQGETKAYTANYIPTGIDASYASDVATLMNLDHTVVNRNADDLLNNLRISIETTEKPNVFTGESLLQQMYASMQKDTGSMVLCFDGSGSEGILGASRVLYELKLIRLYRPLFALILPFLPLISRKLHSRWKEFYAFVNTKTIPDNFILRYFTSPETRLLVQHAFHLHDLGNIDQHETEMMKKSNTTLFESVYRFLAFELEYKRVNNARTQLAKKHNVFLFFPFTETSLFRYFVNIDTRYKLQRAKTKYLFRQSMERKFPRKIVYRKKIRKNIPVFEDILHHSHAIVLMNEMKERKYPYFDFELDRIFSDPANTTLAYKLINFHIWHKTFID